MNATNDNEWTETRHSVIEELREEERLKRGVGSGALTGFSDAKRAEEPGVAEEEGAQRPNPKSLAVSPGKAVPCSQLTRMIEALRIEVFRLESIAGDQQGTRYTLERGFAGGLKSAAHLLELLVKAQPNSEQGKNVGDGLATNEAIEADADPNHGTASGRRNAADHPRRDEAGIQTGAKSASDASDCSAAPDDFEERMMEMDIHELRSRILTQRDYLKKLHSCLDGLPIPADCNTNIDGCRDHHDIRWIVKKLTSRLPNV